MNYKQTVSINKTSTHFYDSELKLIYLVEANVHCKQVNNYNYPYIIIDLPSNDVNESIN